MTTRFTRIAFACILIVHLIAIASEQTTLAVITKPLITISLGIYFLVAVRPLHPLGNWILGALFFSLAGDIFLQLDPNESLYFLLGLSSFLFAHLCYIWLFHQLRKQNNIQPRSWAILLVTVYYALLLTFLTPFLGEMKWPVRVYGIVISFMLMLAIHMLFLPRRAAGISLFLGALLFVASDSILAVNKFYAPLPDAPMLIMSTYGLAQYFIVEGAVRALRPLPLK